MTFSGDLHLPVSEQEAVAESIRQTTRGTVLENVLDEAREREPAGKIADTSRSRFAATPKHSPLVPSPKELLSSFTWTRDFNID